MSNNVKDDEIAEAVEGVSLLHDFMSETKNPWSSVIATGFWQAPSSEHKIPSFCDYVERAYGIVPMPVGLDTSQLRETRMPSPQEVITSPSQVTLDTSILNSNTPPLATQLTVKSPPKINRVTTTSMLMYESVRFSPAPPILLLKPSSKKRSATAPDVKEEKDDDLFDLSDSGDDNLTFPDVYTPPLKKVKYGTYPKGILKRLTKYPISGMNVSEENIILED